MCLTCHACGSVNSLRISATARTFSCCGCGSVYEISIKLVKPAANTTRLIKGSEYVSGKA